MTTAKLPQSYLTELDLSSEETLGLLDVARRMKAEGARDESDLARKHVALYFEKPSVRTRVSFTVAVHHLGGNLVELGPSNTKVGKGEDVADFASVLGRYVDLVVARVFEQQTLRTMAEYSKLPVINALSNERHPCQALADVLTMIERKGKIEGLRVAFIGEGNNVVASTGLLCARLGAEVLVASPPGYGLPNAVLDEASAPTRAGPRGFAGSITQIVDPEEAAHAADVLYTDTWVSMGQEAEVEARRIDFGGYRIDQTLLSHAKSDAIVLHCLPAVCGEEITRDVMYGDASAIWDQAENRLHVQKALMRRLC